MKFVKSRPSLPRLPALAPSGTRDQASRWPQPAPGSQASIAAWLHPEGRPE